MSAPYAADARDGNEEVVRMPRAADGVGAALRGSFRTETLPVDWARLLARLDRYR